MARNRILVVEDDEAISRIITKNLISTGYAAVPVYDGCKAAELVQMDADFDLALLDVMLPGMDGFALLAYMKHHGIHRKIRHRFQIAGTARWRGRLYRKAL